MKKSQTNKNIFCIFCFISALFIAILLANNLSFYVCAQDKKDKDKTSVPEKKEPSSEISKPKPSSAEEKTYTFFGTKIECKKIIFVVDESGSMLEKYYPKKYKEKDEDKKNDKKELKKPEKKKVKKVKLEVVKCELKNIVRNFSKKVYLNITALSSDFRKWKEKLTSLDKETKKEALEFIENIGKDAKETSLTNIYKPLEEALSEEGVEAIYLLTDGMPNSGKVTKGNLFLKKIKKLNKSKKVKINTIGIGLMKLVEIGKGVPKDLGEIIKKALMDMEPEDFLKKLAKQNNGVFLRR